jgi:hypothetical protein
MFDRHPRESAGAGDTKDAKDFNIKTFAQAARFAPLSLRAIFAKQSPGTERGDCALGTAPSAHLPWRERKCQGRTPPRNDSSY